MALSHFLFILSVILWVSAPAAFTGSIPSVFKSPEFARLLKRDPYVWETAARLVQNRDADFFGDAPMDCLSLLRADNPDFLTLLAVLARDSRTDFALEWAARIELVLADSSHHDKVRIDLHRGSAVIEFADGTQYRVSDEHRWKGQALAIPYPPENPSSSFPSRQVTPSVEAQGDSKDEAEESEQEWDTGSGWVEPQRSAPAEPLPMVPPDENSFHWKVRAFEGELMKGREAKQILLNERVSGSPTFLGVSEYVEISLKLNKMLDQLVSQAQDKMDREQVERCRRRLVALMLRPEWLGPLARPLGTEAWERFQASLHLYKMTFRRLRQNSRLE